MRMHKQRPVNRSTQNYARLQPYSRQIVSFKRNNSNLMSTCLTWDLGTNQQDLINQSAYQNQRYYQERHERMRDQSQSISPDQRRNQGRGTETTQRPNERKNSPKDQYPTQKQVKKQQRSGTANKKGQKKQFDYSKYQKTAEQLKQQKLKQQQRRQKIIKHIQQMKPFSRELTHTKFQQYYNKSAPEAYGFGNTTQPIGGSVYGNNYRSFNVNPHDYQNNPQHYQSHTTSLNFAHRTKRDQEGRWKRLQKQLSKKLNLNQKNQTLKQGKKAVYVDINDDNMNEVLKESNMFVRNHRDQIRQSQKDYQQLKQMKSKAEKAKFYRQKAQKLQKNLKQLQQTNTSTTYVNDRAQSQRINEQIVYKHHHKDGTIRTGCDRHALTCFVDLNFPQNDKLYTEELKRRMPIFPTEVEDRHKNLDLHRKQNFIDSKKNIYPSHYLLPCNEQPQIAKMLAQRGRERKSSVK